MLLPYATVKPHDPADCRDCTRTAPGHQVCMNPTCPGRSENDGAGRVAVFQVRRHATDDEYAALPLAHIPVDGIAHKAAFACDDCAELAEPFCEHPPPSSPPCPVCQADGEAPCLKQDRRTPRWAWHSTRQHPQLERCDHAHRPDCGIFTGCACTGDDEPPARPAHPATLINDGNGPDVSRLLFDPAYAQLLLQQQGVHWWQVRRADSRLTQDNKPCLWAEVAQVDERGHIQFDEHGHEILSEVVIVIEVPQN